MAAKSADQARQQAMESWQSQIIASNQTVSGAGTTAGGTKIGVNQTAVDLYNMTDAERLQIAKTLKNAGYSVPQTGKYNDKLVQQWSNATMAAQMSAQQLGQTYDKNFLNGWLQQEQIANTATGGTGAVTSGKRTIVYDPTQSATVINAVYSDLLGRQASKQELDKYTKMLQKAQKANPQDITNVKGPGYTQTGGLDPQQFLIEQISGTDEAKANQVMGYYNTFKNLIGVK